MRSGLFKPVHVKSLVAQEQRLLLTSPKLLQRKLLDLESELRGTLPTLVGSRRRRRPGSRQAILLGGQRPSKIRLMLKPSIPGEEQTQQTPATTLGDVLYANSKALVPEQEWTILVQSIAAGEQLALHALYERAHRVVFTLIIRITANREIADELTIDVFHDIWRRAARYEPEKGTVLAWIMNRARSRAIDRLRFESRQKRRHGDDVLPLAATVADPRDVMELRDQSKALRSALATLSPSERHAIETTFFGGLTHAEAAAQLNQPLGTLKTRIRSGLHKLRQALAAEVEKP